jgi:hypothetical protein
LGNGDTGVMCEKRSKLVQVSLLADEIKFVSQRPAHFANRRNGLVVAEVFQSFGQLGQSRQDVEVGVDDSFDPG